MVKIKFHSAFLHPAFISLVIWIILVLLIPVSFSKYRVKKISEEVLRSNVYYFYKDLDLDGNSELITFDLADNEQTKIMVMKDDKILNQYNLKYHPEYIRSLFTGDYNYDNKEEFYVFTISQDSIFLSIIDATGTGEAIVNMRFIDSWIKNPQSNNMPYIHCIGILTNPEINYRDFYFYITSGFCKQPRNVYRYVIGNDSLIKSPLSGAVIDRCIVSELDEIPGNEFVLNTRATGNLDENVPYTDQYSWLMVLNNDLEFLFPPLKFYEYPSRLSVVPICHNGEKRLVAFHDYYGVHNFSSSFYLFDIFGNKLAEEEFNDNENTYSRLFINEDSKDETFFFLKNRNTEIQEMDCSFNTVRTIKLPEIIGADPIDFLDINLDGRKEYIFLGRDGKSIIITQDNFSNPLVHKFSTEIPALFISAIVNVKEKPLFFLQTANVGTYLRYEKNPFYFFKFLYSPGLYLSVLLFVMIIYKMLKHRLEIERNTEKEIASLQMKAIKNQIDPHFTLNILNSIGSLYASGEDMDKADYIFGKYAKMIRQTVINSEQIIIPLEEEIDFVKNYIELERFRNSDSFSFIIDINPNVDLKSRIPRMLIHTYVENAIKYGIRRKLSGGFLKIFIQYVNRSIRIIIEDNGPGLNSTNTLTNSTGKGFVIVKQLIDLFHKLEKIRISTSMNNITGQNGEVLGARAVIELPVLKS